MQKNNKSADRKKCPYFFHFCLCSIFLIWHIWKKMQQNMTKNEAFAEKNRPKTIETDTNSTITGHRAETGKSQGNAISAKKVIYGIS